MGWLFVFVGYLFLAKSIHLKRGTGSFNSRLSASVFGTENLIQAHGRLGIGLSFIGIVVLLFSMGNTSRIIAIALILGFAIRFYKPYYLGKEEA